MAIVIPRLKENLTFNYSAVVDILTDLNLDVSIFVDMDYKGSMLADNIELLKNVDADLIVIPLEAHPSELVTYASWWDKLNSMNRPYLVLTSMYVDNVNSLFCPIWPIIYPSKYITVEYPSKVHYDNSYRKYIYSCLNNRFTLDRAINLIVWEKYDQVLSPEHLVTMISGEDIIKSDAEAKEQLRLLDNLLKQQNANYKDIFYNNLLPRFPIKNDKAFFNSNPFEVMNNAFLNSNLNVITEHWHYTQTPFISEKSLKPILGGQFFVHTGSVGSLDIMRDIGIDTYDDIIDHSVYENKIDLFEKMEAIHVYLQEIKNWNWKELYRATVERRAANRDLLFSNIIQDNFAKQLVKKIYEILR